MFEQLEVRKLLAAAPLPEFLSEDAGIDSKVAAALSRVSDLDSYDRPVLQAVRQWLIGYDSAGVGATIENTFANAVLEPTQLIPDTYVLTLPAAISGISAVRMLDEIPALDYFAPMVAKQQSPRLIPNDPNFPNQWHLRNTGQSGGFVGADANVTSVWDQYRGAGVTVASVDDGITTTHPDLAPNYVPQYSFDFNSNEPDPSPGSHGTSVAGVMAARGNNGIGVSGAAPEASLAGIRLIAGAVTDQTEANALTYFKNNIDIYNNSWGPNDGGTTLEGAGPLTLAAFIDATANGRNGLGNIYTWAGGNGGNGDNVNYDGYANDRRIIAVGAITNGGVRSSFSERGAPVLVGAYSAGGTLGISTTSSSGYTSSFGGTSAAAPLAAGVIALMLDANPNLTWRDVQHILVNTARKTDLADPGWSVNGAGHDINDKYGYGAIDAAPAVALAQTWATVAPEVSATSGVQNVSAAIPDGIASGVSRTITINDPIKVESVEVVFNASHLSRGQLRVVLTSPDGTQSILAEPRADAGDNYNNWVFTSKRHWDEEAAGDWTLTVYDPTSGTAGTWNSWTLNVYGTQQGQGIYGTAYDDADADSTRDGGEAGVNNVSVFIDSNNDGDLDVGEPSTTTNSNGAYAFADLADGTYVVRSIVPAGLRPTQGSSAYSVTLAGGAQVATNRNFGFVNPTISGVVFNDANDNSTFDSNEAPRSGAMVFIDSNDDGDLDTGEPNQTTGANGVYAFSGLADGFYVVRMQAPAGTRQTAPQAAYGETISSSQLSATNRNFGVTAAARIQGKVYEDANANGRFDFGESGIPDARVFMDLNNNGSFDNTNAAYPSTNVPLPVVDAGTMFSNLNISGVGTITNVRVQLNITHTWNSDLDLFLISPAGTRIELSTDNGGSGDNYTNTIFDDAAATSITTGTAPFSGSFRPEQPLATLNGQDGNGLWRLEVTDDLGSFTGTLNSWSVLLNSTEPNVLTPASGDYSFTPLAAGNYLIRQVPLEGGFSFTNPASGAYNVTAATAEILDRDFGNASAFASSNGFYVRLNGAGDKIEIFQDTVPSGAPDFTLPRASTPALNLIGSANDDQLYVDLVNGTPIPTGDIKFNGGDGDDTVIMIGTEGSDGASFNGDEVQDGSGNAIDTTSTERFRFDGRGGNDTLIYNETIADPTFIGGAGRNLLFVQAPTWAYDVDAATQNEEIDVHIGGGEATVLFFASQHLRSLQIFGGRAELRAPGTVLRTADGLTITPGGTFDVGPAGAVLDYTSASPLADVRGWLTSGYAGGAWNGAGISSSDASTLERADAVGYAEASELFTSFPATFMGESVDSTTLLMRYTLDGDANLDGSVNISDFSQLAANFNSAGGWAKGNFNYDNIVNISDFAMLAANFNQSLPGDLPRAPRIPTVEQLRTTSPFSSRLIQTGEPRVVDDLLADTTAA